MPIDPVLRTAVAERERIKKKIGMKLPQLTEENMERAIREFASARTNIPPFGFHFEVGHSLIQQHLEQWMKDNTETPFRPSETKLFKALRGTRHALPEGHPDRQLQVQAANRIAELPTGRGQARYKAFHEECSRIVAMASKVQKRLTKLSDVEEHRQPHKYGSMFTNPLATIAMIDDLQTYRSIIAQE
ncbi:hypothetical protein HY994_06960 [Candidatus Micrarchaeota archaeon]|nr:hypothetical protein [Candidatus Micrarchaeota archaeon]